MASQNEKRSPSKVGKAREYKLKEHTYKRWLSAGHNFLALLAAGKLSNFRLFVILICVPQGNLALVVAIIVLNLKPFIKSLQEPDIRAVCWAFRSGSGMVIPLSYESA